MVDLLLDALDDLVAVVDVLDPGLAQQVVEHPGSVLGEVGALGGHWRHDDHAEEREHAEQPEEDDRHREPTAHVLAGEPLDQGVESQGQEERDDEEGDRRVEASHRLDDGVGGEHPDRSDEPDVEGGLPVERRARAPVVPAWPRATTGPCIRPRVAAEREGVEHVLPRRVARCGPLGALEGRVRLGAVRLGAQLRDPLALRTPVLRPPPPEGHARSLRERPDGRGEMVVCRHEPTRHHLRPRVTGPVTPLGSG